MVRGRGLGNPRMSGPLSDVMILDLTRLQPGNYATMLLADLGADVVKVEEPGRGDYARWMGPMVGTSSAMHQVMNRNKRSVTLNLKAHQAAEIFLKLVATADVVIESFRPGVMDRLGFGYERLKEANPDLIYAAITGFGQDGPYRLHVGHDINYIAIGGLLETTGEPGGPPVLPSVQVADLSGAMMAVVGVLAALHRRTAKGEGEFVDVGMMDAAVSWLALHLAGWFAGDDQLERGAGLLNGGYPFYRVYRCADGRYLSVGAIEPQFWEAVCNTIGLEELTAEQFAQEPRRSEIHRILESRFESKTRDDWVLTFAGIDACVAPVNDFEEMASDPQVTAREMILDGKALRQMGIPLKFAVNPGSVRRPAPELGEHNAEIYEALGVEAHEIARLQAGGVI